MVMAKNTVANCDLFPRSGGKVLVVDDEKDIALVIKRALECYGFTVDAFSDPGSALKNFKPGSYDLVLTDVRMPKMDGFELYREIRRIDGAVKVCFLSAFETYQEELKTIGVRCFIKKPVSIGDLLEIVRGQLESA
jgi:two-component system catabolic regulation response regulator CreB/two-component system response regulator ChvI